MHMLKIDTPSLSCNKRGEKNMVIKSDRLLTLEEAAYFLNLSPRTLYRKIHDNELLALKIGSLWRLRKVHFLVLLISHYRGEGTITSCQG